MRATIPLVVAVLASGCAMAPPREAQAPSMPPRWDNGAVSADAIDGRIDGRWWQAFNDPVLSALVEQALAANHDLGIAAARLREARAAAGIARSALAPQLNAGAEAGIRRDDLQTERLGQPDVDASYYQAGFDASWEIDVFGGRRAGVQAAEADIAAARGASDEILVSVVAEVARSYVEMRGAQTRIEVAERNIDLQRQAIELLGSRVRAGLAPELDVARAESDLESLRASVPPLQALVDAQRYRLAVLTGRSPSGFNPGGDARLPDLASPPQAGLPSSLLERRPDVRRAQAEVDGANARVGVARADLYPKFYISGLLARAEESGGGLSLGPGMLYALAPTIRLPILSGGRIRANIDVRDAQLDAALLRYEQTVLRALQDVETALVAVTREQERLTQLSASVESATLARELALDAYRAGLEDYFGVLDAQRQQLGVEDAQAASRTAALVHRIALYKALGGGWRDHASQATAPRNQEGT
jgi:NodT family efflux transporter outer membrane factor (OMF) lipoprotein